MFSNLVKYIDKTSLLENLHIFSELYYKFGTLFSNNLNSNEDFMNRSKTSTF